MAVPTLTIEFYLNGAWVDVTSYVLEKSKYQIQRGEADEHGRLKTTSLSLSLNNSKPGAVGLWSSENPSSTYFGLLVPGMPVRVTRGSEIRCVLEARSFSDEWGHAEAWAYVRVTATGIFGQLSQGGQALESPVYRDVMRKHNDVYRVAYWSMEGDDGTTVFNSPVADVLPLSVQNISAVSIGAFSSPGSRNLPTLSTSARLTAVVPRYTSSEHKIVTIWDAPAGSIPNNGVMERVFFGGGSVAYIDLVYNTTGGGALRLIAYNNLGTQLDASGFIGFALDDTHFLTSMEVTQDGADLDVVIVYQEINATDPQVGVQGSDTFTGLTVGYVTDVIIAPGNDLNGVSVGHLGVSNDISGLAALDDATIGHASETAGARLSRLATEEGLTFFISGVASLTRPMGIQTRSTLIELFNECITVDQGILRENRTVYAITYIPGYATTNLVPSLTLDYDSSHFGPQLPRSAKDDFLVHNDVTTIRPDGGRGRAFIETGPLSVNAPPDGIGTYDRGPITANVYTDDQLEDVAGWIANVRTPLERRWSQIQVEIGRAPFEADTSLRDDVLAIGVGDLIALENLPIFVAPETHYAVIRGWQERGDKFTAQFDIYTTPYWPYEVEVVETSGSALAHAVSDSATTWRLYTTSGPEWDTTYEPYHIQCGNEAVTVTTMATATAAFIAAGTASTANGANTTPGMPAGITVDVAQLLLLAAWTDAAAGTIDTPTGWTLLAGTATGKLRVFYKYYVTGDSGPTVAVTGDAAGDINISQICAFSGLSHVLDDGDYGTSLASPQRQANSSAANIATPALSVRRDGVVVIALGARSEDWVSVATLSGYDGEIGEPDDGTGNRSGMVWDYDIQATASDKSTDAFTVTGGVAGTGESLIFALRPLQTATVTRSVNSVAQAHSVGDAVTTWRLGVSAL